MQEYNKNIIKRTITRCYAGSSNLVQSGSESTPYGGPIQNTLLYVTVHISSTKTAYKNSTRHTSHSQICFQVIQSLF